jgi:hypothetical protein
MKTVSVLAVLLALVAGCSSVRTLDSEEIPVYTLNEVRANPQDLAGILDGDSKGVIVSVPQGDRLPLEIDVRVPFAHLETGRSWIRFDRNVWFYFAPGDMLISPDGERFGPVYDLGALKELFQFETGNVSLGFGVSAQEGAKAVLRMGAE